MAGSILATRIFTSNSKLRPIQKIIIDPTNEIPFVMAVDNNGAMSVANNVIVI
jgi:hypothetical protein